MEAHYLEALCQPKAMHTATVTKILVALGNFLQEKRPADAPMLESIAMHHGFNLSEMYGGGASKPKKVAFAIDYSGRFRALVVTTTSSYIMNNLKDYLLWLLTSYRIHVWLQNQICNSKRPKHFRNIHA